MVFLFVSDILIARRSSGAALLGVGPVARTTFAAPRDRFYALAIALVGLVALEIASGAIAATGEAARAAEYTDGSFLEVARRTAQGAAVAEHEVEVATAGQPTWSSAGVQGKLRDGGVTAETFDGEAAGITIKR